MYAWKASRKQVNNLILAKRHIITESFVEALTFEILSKVLVEIVRDGQIIFRFEELEK